MFALFDVGSLSLSLAFASAMTSLMLIIAGVRRASTRFMRSGVYVALLHNSLLTISIVAMTYYLVTRDFQVGYVAMYTDRSLSLVYAISALWAGPSGSLLFWSWLLSLFIALFIIAEKKDTLSFYAVSIMMSVNVFFIGLLIVVSNPFARLDFTPADGQGLNPLLQNFGMLLHPPTFFIGYASLTIPYSLAMAGLVSEREIWLLRARRWALIGWLFLGLGILIGAMWSYVVLGWGGYWAWDPVENASLIPWLLSTAYLHSVMVQESRRGMKLWNILLVIFTFMAVVFATFITRSGVLVSVHAFALTGVGPAFSLYLIVMLFFSLGLVAWRYGWLVGMEVYESPLGRETSFLLNNLMLTVIAITVFWGTIYPLISEAVTGAAIRVGPSFYEAVFKPLFAGTVALMGFCVMLKWRHTEPRVILRRSAIPTGVSVLFTLLMILLGYGDLLLSLSSFVATFAIASHIMDFVEDVGGAGGLRGRFLKAFRLILAKRRRYGGYVIHASVALILVGYMVSSLYSSSYSLDLRMGETIYLRGYSFTLIEVETMRESAKAEIAAEIRVEDPSGASKLLRPTLEYYPKFDSTIGRVSVWSRPRGDVYLIPQVIGEEVAKISVKFVPLVSLIWLGGLILLPIGLLIALIPRSFVKRVIGGKHEQT